LQIRRAHARGGVVELRQGRRAPEKHSEDEVPRYQSTLVS
jgi:hypothetical protein